MMFNTMYNFNILPLISKIGQYILQTYTSEYDRLHPITSIYSTVTAVYALHI